MHKMRQAHRKSGVESLHVTELSTPEAYAHYTKTNSTEQKSSYYFTDRAAVRVPGEPARQD